MYELKNNSEVTPKQPIDIQALAVLIAAFVLGLSACVALIFALAAGK
jgi:hypothetical protein